jgi:recombination associated protein RdgC
MTMKNMMLYRITCPTTQRILNDWEALSELLARKKAYLPTGGQWRALGFDLPVPSFCDMLVYSGPGGCNLFSLYVHERMLPGATIREHVFAKCKKIEDRENRKCYAKERAQIRDEVMAELLPKAFIKHSYIPMLVIGDLLVVDTSSAKKAEDALSTLRDAMGSLPVRPISYTCDMVGMMTAMVDQDDAYDHLSPGQRTKLMDSEGAQITVKDLDLNSEAITEHRNAGFKPHELQMYLHDRDDESILMTFTLTDKLIFKGVKFPDLVLDKAKNEADGDAAAYYDASLFIFCDIVRNLVKTFDEAVEEVVYERKEAYTPPAPPEDAAADEYRSPNLSQSEQQEAVDEEDDTFAVTPAAAEEDDDL